MNKKLTLNVDEGLIEFAHEYSRKTDQSISSVFEKYLTRLRKNTQPNAISQKAKELHGLFANSQLPDKKEMRKEFYEKSTG